MGALASAVTTESKGTRALAAWGEASACAENCIAEDTVPGGALFKVRKASPPPRVPPVRAPSTASSKNLRDGGADGEAGGTSCREVLGKLWSVGAMW